MPVHTTKTYQKIDTISSKIDRVERDFKAEVQDVQDVQAISLGSDCARLASLPLRKEFAIQWMKDIEKCVLSGYKACALVKGIVQSQNVDTKKIRMKPVS